MECAAADDQAGVVAGTLFRDAGGMRIAIGLCALALLTPAAGHAKPSRRKML